MPADLDVHLIVDNYGTHKHAKVKKWLARRPRFHIHFTPTYASWLNQVEIWLNIITRRAIRRGSFRKVKELIQRIERTRPNGTPTPIPLCGRPRPTRSSPKSSDYVNVFLRQDTRKGAVEVDLAVGPARPAIRKSSSLSIWAKRGSLNRRKRVAPLWVPRMSPSRMGWLFSLISTVARVSRDDLCSPESYSGQ